MKLWRKYEIKFSHPFHSRPYLRSMNICLTDWVYKGFDYLESKGRDADNAFDSVELVKIDYVFLPILLEQFLS